MSLVLPQRRSNPLSGACMNEDGIANGKRFVPPQQLQHPTAVARFVAPLRDVLPGTKGTQ
jgi:hypothetical protein